ncbi:dual specificity mitogen-activated protein kinase kinase 4 isoform X1 [Lates japonicus]|uniref:Dual specificity mitogen-activated protein kinase kinase 4 isoform X1 n=1 Tax=Lates japonicus TaxID=270547 RepID=A0AAD3M8G1_LATJO|nr:dual specificity mitogen-activated protein kinase kinase 4 isoform X1 [Lates japonicus]
MATPSPNNSTTPSSHNSSNNAGSAAHHHHQSQSQHITTMSSMQESNTCWRCQSETGFQINLSGAPPSKPNLFCFSTNSSHPFVSA